MYYFIEIACIISEIWMIYMFLNCTFQKRKNAWYKTASIFTLFGLSVAILSFIENIALIRLSFTFIGVFGISSYLFDSKIIRGILSSLTVCTFVSLTDILTTVLLTTCGMTTSDLMLHGFARSLYLIVGHIIMFAFFIVMCVINQKNDSMISLKTILPISPCWIISILLSCLLTWEYIHSNKDLPSLYLIVMLGLLYTNIIIIYYTNRITLQTQHQKELELAAHHYAMQQEYYEQFRCQREEILSIWHDISKYLKAIETDNSSQALIQVKEIVHSVTDIVDVNNRVINVILNEYVQIAKTKNIQLKLDVQIPEELSITAVDLYILLGNTLDNAFNACEHLPENERIVFLKLKAHNEILFYEIINPFSPFHIKNSQSRFHGYGLKNVQQCIEKYNGTFNINKENGIFQLTAHLNGLY